MRQGRSLRATLLIGTLLAPLPVTGQESMVTGGKLVLIVTLEGGGGEVVADARVRLRRAGDGSEPHELEWSGGRLLLMAAPGRYRSGDLVPGLYSVRAEALGYETVERRIRLGKTAVRVLRFRLSPIPIRVDELVAYIERQVAAPGHSVTEIELSSSALPLHSLADRLQSQAGVDVRERGPGGPQTVSLRGSRADGVLVLLDGIPLNDPITGVADLSLVSVSTLGSATIIRGSTAAFGPGALGGAILLRSTSAPDGAVSGGLEIGSFGKRAADVHASLGGRAGRISIDGRFATSINDFVYRNRTLSGEPLEPRRNADARSWQALLTGSTTALPFSVSLRIGDLDRGAPGGMGTRLFDQARWSESSLQAGALVGDLQDGGITTGYRVRRARYSDPAGAVFQEQRSTDWRGRGRLPIGPGGRWSISGHFAHEAVSGEALAEPSRRTSGGLALTGRFRLRSLGLHPGLALDLAPGERVLSPSLALDWTARGGWRLWGRAGQAYRLPTFGDLYFAAGYWVRPNPELSAERVRLDLESGVEWHEGAAAVRLALYHRVTEDPIVWLANPVGVWSPRNLERLVASGAELDLRTGAGGWSLEGVGSVTRSRVGFGTNRNPVPYTAEWSGHFALNRRVGKGIVRGEIGILGSRTTTLAATHRLPAFATLDLVARAPLSVGGTPLTIDLRLRNLLDARYELVELFPEPGRALELRIGFGPMARGEKAEREHDSTRP